jgi:integrase
MEERIHVWVCAFKDRKAPMLQWTDPETGKRKSQSAGAVDAGKVESARGDLEYQLNNGLRNQKSKMPWESFRGLYEKERLAGCRAGTRAKAGYVFDSFEDLASPRTLGQITERTLSRYSTALREKGFKAATIQGHLAYLRAALRWAADQRIITTAPKVTMPKVPKKTNIRKIDVKEFETLRSAALGPWRLFLSVAWHTGMRRNEMLDLTWDNQEMPRVDFRENRIWLPAAYNKSDADQWIPLHPDLVAMLQDQPSRKGFLFAFRNAPKEVSRKVTKLAKGVGLKITLHDLRRSFGSRYASAVPAPVLQRLMRHADIKTTLAFYTNVDDVLGDAILKA